MRAFQWARLVALGAVISTAMHVEAHAKQFQIQLGTDGMIAANQEQQNEECLGPGSDILFVVQASNPSDTAEDVSVMVAHPPEAPVVLGSCIASLGTCTTDPLLLSWMATIPPFGDATARYRARVAPGVPAGTELCFDVTVQFGSGEPSEIELCIETTSDVACVQGVPAMQEPALALLYALLAAVGFFAIRRSLRRPM